MNTISPTSFIKMIRLVPALAVLVLTACGGGGGGGNFAPSNQNQDPSARNTVDSEVLTRASDFIRGVASTTETSDTDTARILNTEASVVTAGQDVAASAPVKGSVIQSSRNGQGGQLEEKVTAELTYVQDEGLMVELNLLKGTQSELEISYSASNFLWDEPQGSFLIWKDNWFDTVFRQIGVEQNFGDETLLVSLFTDYAGDEALYEEGVADCRVLPDRYCDGGEKPNYGDPQTDYMAAGVWVYTASASSGPADVGIGAFYDSTRTLTPVVALFPENEVSANFRGHAHGFYADRDEYRPVLTPGSESERSGQFTGNVWLTADFKSEGSSIRGIVRLAEQGDELEELLHPSLSGPSSAMLLLPAKLERGDGGFFTANAYWNNDGQDQQFSRPERRIFPYLGKWGGQFYGGVNEAEKVGGTFALSVEYASEGDNPNQIYSGSSFFVGAFHAENEKDLDAFSEQQPPIDELIEIGGLERIARCGDYGRECEFIGFPTEADDYAPTLPGHPPHPGEAGPENVKYPDFAGYDAYDELLRQRRGEEE